jgi:hypothetical protein
MLVLVGCSASNPEAPSALLYYGSENEVESFAEAAINQASRSE